jgi:DNA end-binding protein Ku
MRDEVVNIAGALENIQRGKSDKKMIDIALRIINQQEGEFDPDEFTDRYENALRALIEEKKRGHKITRVQEPADTSNVVDLMEALRKSLGKRAQPAKAASAPKRTASLPKGRQKRR